MTLRIPKIIIKFLIFLSQYIKMGKMIQRSIVPKQNFKKLMSTLLPIVKKVVSNQINKIKLSIILKIKSNKKQNTLKSVSNREIKSLKRVKTTKGVINTPKIVAEKPLLVEEPKVITLPKIAAKSKKVIKPKKVDKVEIHTEKVYNYCEFKNRVNKQLIKHFKKLHDTKKSKYLDDDDAEIAENDYYKPILVKSFHNDGYKEYESRGDKIIPYLKELIDIHKAIENNSKKWKVQLNAKIKKCFFR